MNELAIHEAGHAIMCDALGVAIEFVSIAAGCEGEEASFEGCVKLKNECNPISDVMAATLAGPAASFFIAGVPPDARATAKYRSDQKTLRTIFANQSTNCSYDEFWSRLQQLLRGWIRVWLSNKRETVLRFAEHLQKAQTLKGGDLEKALHSAWGSSKPDVELTRREVKKALVRALNPDLGLTVYRLVNHAHDPIEVGTPLLRSSNHSNQKLAEGIYFCMTREDALNFAKVDHGHTYTHVVTCQLEKITKDDFVDLVSNPNAITKVKSTHPFEGLHGRRLNHAYCEVEGKLGLIWKSIQGWTEVCLLTEHIGGAVLIVDSEPLVNPPAQRPREIG